MTDKLVIETSESLTENFRALGEESEKLASLLSDQKINDFQQRIVGYLDVVNWCIEAITHLKNLGYTIDVDLETINELLIELEGAMKIGDTFAMADIFEYELSPLFVKLSNESIKKVD